MQITIGSDSVLGFIPTNYPAGVVLCETWDSNLAQIVRYVGLINDIDNPDDWAHDCKWLENPVTPHSMFTELVGRATYEIAKEA